MPGDAISLVMHDVSPEHEEGFNHWYSDEFMPRLTAIPGVLSGRRFRALSGQPRYLALYELEDIAVPNRPDFWRISPLNPEVEPRSREMSGKFLNRIRGVYQRMLTLPDPPPTDLSNARALVLRALEIDAVHEDEFNDWYSTEHVPAISRVRGLVRAQRFRLDSSARDLLGNPPVYLALYDMERSEVQATDAYRRAVDTPWSARMRRFFTSRMRNIYERI